MRKHFIAVLVLATGVASMASDREKIEHYAPDDLQILSPDGMFVIRNEEGRFVITPRKTQLKFFSTSLPELENSVTWTAKYATWSPGSRMLAVCVHTGKYIEDTFVLMRHGEGTWRYYRLPYTDTDAQVIPLRWLDGDTLVIEISGDYGGKADHDMYVYTMTVRYDRSANHFFKVSETKAHTK